MASITRATKSPNLPTQTHIMMPVFDGLGLVVVVVLPGAHNHVLYTHWRTSTPLKWVACSPAQRCRRGTPRHRPTGTKPPTPLHKGHHTLGSLMQHREPWYSSWRLSCPKRAERRDLQLNLMLFKGAHIPQLSKKRFNSGNPVTVCSILHPYTTSPCRFVRARLRQALVQARERQPGLRRGIVALLLSLRETVCPHHAVEAHECGAPRAGRWAADDVSQRSRHDGRSGGGEGWRRRFERRARAGAAEQTMCSILNPTTLTLKTLKGGSSRFALPRVTGTLHF